MSKVFQVVLYDGNDKTDRLVVIIVPFILPGLRAVIGQYINTNPSSESAGR